MLTKLDVLSAYDQIPLCTHYDNDQPQYEYLQGWRNDISQCRRWEDLPEACKYYINRIETLSEMRIALIGVGPEREAFIPR